MKLDIFDLLFELLQLLGRWSTMLYNWLFEEYTMLGYTFKPFFAIGGTVILVIFTAWIVKQFVPLL